MMKPAALLVAGLAFGMPNASLANDLLAAEKFSGTMLSFQMQQAYSHLTLRVSGPNNYAASTVFPGGAPALDLARYGNVPDGPYTYHLVASTGEAAAPSGNNDGRSEKAANAYRMKSVSKSGSFTVQSGAILSSAIVEPKRTK